MPLTGICAESLDRIHALAHRRCRNAATDLAVLERVLTDLLADEHVADIRRDLCGRRADQCGSIWIDGDEDLWRGRDGVALHVVDTVHGGEPDDDLRRDLLDLDWVLAAHDDLEATPTAEASPVRTQRPRSHRWRRAPRSTLMAPHVSLKIRFVDRGARSRPRCSSLDRRTPTAATAHRYRPRPGWSTGRAPPAGRP